MVSGMGFEGLIEVGGVVMWIGWRGSIVDWLIKVVIYKGYDVGV